MSQQQMREVRTTARQLSKRKQLTRLLLILLILSLLIMSIVFAGASFLNRAGRFTINLDPESFTKYGISISATEDFKDPTILLQGTALKNMWNITKDWILNNPNNKEYYSKGDPTYKTFADIDKVDGDHNGKDYIAYTFWIKNAGTKDAGYYGSLNIDSVAKGADEAIRIMVFRNGVPTEYGKIPKDPKAPYATFGIDKYFLNTRMAADMTNKDFKVGDKDRYTVLIWLEGWDPECVNGIMGGEVKLSMNFKVLEEVAVTDVLA
ncbi:MAG: hypothetical protein WCN92_03605 [Eubacteriales bacterium]